MRFRALGAFALLHASTALAADKPVIAPAPSWVTPLALPATIGAKTEAAVRLLLLDQQLHFGAKSDAIYYHTATLIQTAQGLSSLGNIALAWKPDSDTLTVHMLKVHRGSETIDLLAKGPGFTVLRRENNLEWAMLDGVLTAVTQPEGLQVGDIVETAYSIERSDPLLKGHSDWVLPTALPLTTDQLRASVSWDKGKAMRVRPLAPPVPPVIDKAAGTFRLTANAVPPPVAPNGAPMRFQMGSIVEFSDFTNWAEASALFAPLYVEARKLRDDSSLKARIEKIRAASPDPAKRAEAALALVQDEVRYVYLGMNDGNLRPAQADETWSRRFGDCKAKTALLLALLDGLGIAAEPALVSTRVGDGLDQRLPMLALFDHVIARATIGGKVYWLDGTRSGDTSLARLKVPPFYWALPVRPSGGALEKLTVAPLDAPESITDIRLDARAGLTVPAKARIELTLGGDAGVAMRNQLANLAPADLDRGLRTYWQKQYDFVTPEKVSARFDEAAGVERLSVEGPAKLDWNIGDGRDAHYELDGATIGWRPDFTRAPGADKAAPFAVGYPFWGVIRETIQLPNDGRGFTLSGIDVDRQLAGYQLKRTTKLEGGTVSMEVSQRALVPEISVQEAERSTEPLRELSKQTVHVRPGAGYRLTAAESTALLARPAESARDYVWRARAFWQQGKYAEMLPELDKAVAIDPKNRIALAMRAAMHATLNHEALALQDADRVLAIDPADPDGLRVKALVGVHKNPKAALALLDQEVASRPSDANLLALRAQAEMLAGEKDKALADAARALKADPRLLDLYLLRARVFQSRGEKALAVAEAHAMTAANQGNETAWALAGAIIATAGDRDEGMRAFDRSVAIKPNLTAYLSRAHYRPTDDKPGRRADIDAALKLDPHSADALRMLVEEQGSEDPAAARQTLARLVALEPGDAASLIDLGVAQAKAGEAKAAHASFAKVRADAAQNAVMLNNLCYEQAVNGFELDAALADCDASLALRPDDAPTLDSRGFVLLRLGRYAEAITAFDKALKLSPGLADSLFCRGVAKRKAGDVAGGDADLAAARKSAPDIDQVFKRRGVTVT